MPAASYATPSNLLVLHAAWGLVWCALGALALATFRARADLRAAASEVPRTTWLVLVALLALQTTVALWVVPAAPWHSFHHGEERYATLRDGSVWTDALATTQHGPTATVLLRVGLWVTGSPMSSTVLLSLLGTLAGFALARALIGDDVSALTVTAVHALMPVRLRVAHSVAVYVGVEVSLLLALLLATVHLRRRDSASFAVALCALFLAMSAHLELLPIAPLAVLALVASRDPRWFVDVLPRKRSLAMLGLLGLATLPRVLTVLAAPTDVLPAVPLLLDPLHAAARHRALLTLATLVGLGFIRPPLRTAVRPGLASLITLALAVPALSTWAQGPPNPETSTAPPMTAHPPWSAASALLSPDVTPAPWPVLLLVGLAWAWLVRPDLYRFTVATLVAVGWFHLGFDDGISTWVRMASVSAWPFALGVGLGLAVLTGALPGRARGLSAALPVLALAPFLTWLAWAYPTQREFALLLRAHEHVRAGGTVVLPTPADIPKGVDPTRVNVERARSYLTSVVTHPAGRVLGLVEALELDALPEGTLLLEPLACHEALLAPGGVLLLADRMWAWTPTGPASEPFTELSCRSELEWARCVDPACDLWTCAPETPAPRTMDDGQPTDPLCGAVRSRFGWSLLQQTPTPGASLFPAWLAPQAQVGLWTLR